MGRTVCSWRLFGAAMLVGLLPVAARAACELTRYASVDIDINANGGVLVPLQINGHDVWMTLNMSSGMPMVSPAAVSMLGLKTGPAGGSKFFNGTRIDLQARADSLRVGGADFTDWPLYVQPVQRPLAYYHGKPLVGGLSAAFMNAADLELDLADRRMYFPVELDGRQVETSLNTVDRRFWLSERVTRDFFGFQIASPGVAGETLNRPDEQRIYFTRTPAAATATAPASADAPAQPPG